MVTLTGLKKFEENAGSKKNCEMSEIQI